MRDNDRLFNDEDRACEYASASTMTIATSPCDSFDCFLAEHLFEHLKSRWSQFSPSLTIQFPV